MSNLIPSYHLMIEEDDLNRLRKNLTNDKSIFTKLKIENTIYDISIAYRGSYTRKFRKRSYLIGFDDPEEFAGVRKIHLNAEYRDPSLIRNKLSLDFFQDLGVLSPDSQHINLYRNGSFKGVYLQLESVDDMFLKKRGLPTGPIYYAVNNDANFCFTRDDQPKESILSGYIQAFGNPSDDEFLTELISMINTTSKPKFLGEISQHMNMEQFILWLVGAICTMNNDGFTHNYALYRNSDTCLFEVLPWDYDATWGRKVSGGLMEHTYVPIEGKKGNYLCSLLMQLPEFRKRYKKVLEEILDTKFTVEYMEDKVLSLHEYVRPHILLDPYKKNKIEQFDEEPEIIFQFIRDRSNYLRENLSKLD